MKRIILFIYLVFVCYKTSLAYVPPLERTINLTLTNEPVKMALSKIQEQTGLIFSYQPGIVNGIEPVTVQLKNKTVREALSLILPKNIFYKSKSNYIILKEKPEEKNPKKTEISGYVYDKQTDQKVPNVTIYDKESLQSVTTNEYGYYSISVPASNEKISINKENYQDTTLSLTNAKDNTINNILLEPLSDSQKKRDSVRWRDRFKDVGVYTNSVFKKVRGFVNTLNVRDTLFRTTQVSLIPFVGTNHKLSGNVVNNLSFNVIGGFAKGVNGLELGTVFNIDRKNVKGLQAVGGFNIVGDSVKGVQLAGYFNITGSSMDGFQGAGSLNINLGNQKGVQLASVLNINKKRSEGVSMAGAINVSNSVKGAQLAGVGNVNDTLNGLAMAGLFNVTEYGKKSVQVSGLFNTQKEGSSFFQLASLFNTTGNLKGVQIAVFNYADSATGVPIGLLSITKKGVHQIELSGDEFFYANLSFRTGVNAFYNIFSIGYQQGASKTLWQLGYGAGTSLKIKNKLRTEVTATMHHVSSGSFFFGTSELYRIYVGLEYKVGKKFSIAAGPTYNIYMSDALLPDYKETYNNIVPYFSSNTTTAYDFNLKSWFGGRIALRFL